MGDKTTMLIAFYTYASRQFYNIKGLALSLIIPFLLMPFIADFFLKFKDEGNNKYSFLGTIPFYVLLYLFMSLLIVAVWLIRRSIPKIKKEKTGILFGPAHSDEIRKELDDISNKLRREIEDKDIAKMISIKRLPPNIEVGGHAKNLEVLNKANASVLICGNFESFTSQGKQITGFSSLTISVRRLPATPQQTPVLLTDAMAGRQLGWTTEDTIHKNVVVNNLSEIARYIVGLSLIADLQFDKAQTILGPLLIEVKQKYNQKRLPIEIQRFKKTINTAYAVSLVDKILEEYNSALTEEKLYSLDMKVLQRWKDTLNEGLTIHNQYFGALLLLGIIQFLIEDVVGAKDSIRRARRFVPLQSQNLCDLSEAFLLCFEGNLRDSRKLYKRLTKNPPSFQMMKNVFSFLHQTIEKYDDKSQIRFVYALLNDEYGDKFLALDEFKKFTLETEGNDFYRQWNREANLRIRRIKQSDESESVE